MESVVVAVQQPRASLNGDLQDGIEIKSLEPGATVIVQTLHSEYRLRVLNSACGSVLAQGGNLLPESTRAVLQGSSDGGNALKLGWIGIGLRMELFTVGRRIITSRVCSMSVER